MLIGLGILSVLGGNFVGGLWWFLIGLFLQGSAGAAYQRMVEQEALKGQTVRRVMTADPVTAPADITVAHFIDDYLYRYGHELFPVMSDGKLIGCVTMRELKEVPPEQRQTMTLRDVVDGCSEENTIAAETGAGEALARMQKSGRGRLLVVDGGRLAGVLSLKDLLRRLALKSELEGSA